MTGNIAKWTVTAGSIVLIPMLLGGCFGMDDPSTASPEAGGVRTADAEQPPVRTVRGSRRRAKAVGGPELQVADSGPVGSPGSALPKPSEIFDFHPRGSKPDAWRQPFIIDPNDGPLAGYVRRMDAELAETTATPKAAAQARSRRPGCPTDGPAGSLAMHCGENDVARALAR